MKGMLAALALWLFAPGAFAEIGTPVQNSSTGHWYAINDEPLPWVSARQAAEAASHNGWSGHLATIGSETENLWILQYLDFQDNGSAWIGGFQPPEAAEPDKGWQWVTQEEWSYERWAPGEPNDQGGEDALELSIARGGGWNDLDAAQPRISVIEFEPPPAPPVIDSVADLGAGWARLQWNNAAAKPPNRMWALAYDTYARAWVDRHGSPWQSVVLQNGFVDIWLGHSGAYHVWTANHYTEPNEEIHISQNPWTGILFGNQPHAPLDFELELDGWRRIQAHWNPDLYGAWHLQLIAWHASSGWVKTTASDGTNYYHFFMYPEDEFIYGTAHIGVPLSGEYTFFLRSVGWMPQYGASDWAVKSIVVWP